MTGKRSRILNLNQTPRPIPYDVEKHFMYVHIEHDISDRQLDVYHVRISRSTQRKGA